MPRISFIITVSMLSAFGLIASDVYLPAMPRMSTDFGLEDWQMPQTVSFYLLTLSVAQLAYGPLSDRHGRKPVLMAGGLLYLAGSLGCATSDSYIFFLSSRMIEALGAAAGLVIGRAMISDTCDKRTSAKVYAIIYPLVSLSPALAPAIGGHLATIFGWQADFIFVGAFAFIALLMTLLFLPETLNSSSRIKTSPFSGLVDVLSNKKFRCYTVIVCAIYCSWFVYLTQSPFLFFKAGLSEEQSGWLYLPLTAGIIFANILTKRLLDLWHYNLIVTTGVVCFVIGGIMFLFISIKGWNEAWAIVLPMFMVSLANGSSLSLSVSGAISGEHRNFATASGLVGFFQIGSAALMAMGISATFGTNIFVLAGAIMAFSLIALISCITLLKEKLPRSV